jgi:hypothetical protein
MFSKRILINITVGLVMLTALGVAAHATTGTRTLPSESDGAAFLSSSPDRSAGSANPSAGLTGAPSITLECEGNACGLVTLTFDETKQQYLAQNNSDRLIRVEASNWAGGRSVIIEAGKSAYLPLKSFIGPYRANYE